MFLKGLHLIHQYRFSQLISILAKVKKNSATGEVGEIDQLVESFRTNQGRTLSVCCLTPRETRWSNVSFPSQHMPEADAASPAADGKCDWKWPPTLGTSPPHP